MSADRRMKILLIAPYRGLMQVASKAAEDYKEVDIDICYGNYVTGPRMIKEKDVDQIYQAIITRGGTVLTCSQVTTLPVIEIQASAFDVFRIIKQVEYYQGKKAFFAFSNLSSPFRQFCELLNVSIDTFEYSSHADAETELGKLKEKGYQLVIGDNIVYQKAQEMGLYSLLLTSGEESVHLAIKEAIRFCRFTEKRPPLYISNNQREQRDTGKMVCNLPYVSVQNINEMSVSDVDAVFPKSLLEKISDYAVSPLSTVIIGEHGMCKSEAAYLLCCYAGKRTNHFIRIACGEIPEDIRELEEFLLTAICKDGEILFLEHIDELSMDKQKKISGILKQLSKKYHIKFLSSMNRLPAVCVKERCFYPVLRNILGEAELQLFSLKNYENEIENMISVYLAKYDMRNGSYIAGIEKGGRKLLSVYPWPENIRQFMRVVNKLSLSEKRLFLTERDVRKILEEESKALAEEGVLFNLSGTLQEIEKRIIYQIMLEEGHNQAKVEKRLHISHSTLWRKLKQYGLI